jgi:hypothetical protein
MSPAAQQGKDRHSSESDQAVVERRVDRTIRGSIG